jgi:hypothetical protein
MSGPRSDTGQRTTRTRSSEHAARTPKGHPLREARRQRAAARLALHVYSPDRCKEGCPKR